MAFLSLFAASTVIGVHYMYAHELPAVNIGRTNEAVSCRREDPPATGKRPPIRYPTSTTRSAEYVPPSTGFATHRVRPTRMSWPAWK